MRAQDGSWSLTYRFSEPQTALLFDTSHGDYRTQHWTPRTPGMVVENHGGLDGMFFETPSRTAVFDIEPAPSSGTPAFMVFSDGSAAFFTGQLALLTIGSREEAIALDGNLAAWNGAQPPVQVKLVGEGLVGGEGTGPERLATAVHGGGPFVYSGTLPVTDRVLLDPGLPGWVQSEAVNALPRVLADLQAQWDQDLEPSLIALAWGGGEGRFENRGYAYGDEIFMTIRGSAYLEENDRSRADLLWFWSHELTHLHQARNEGRGASWMVEGLADTLATATLVRLGLYDESFLERRYWGVARECARELTGRRLQGVRGRVSYVCGDLAGVAMLSMLPKHDLPAVWKEARSTRAEIDNAALFAALRAHGASEAAVAELERFVVDEHPDTDAAIRRLLEAAGAEPVYREGSLSTMRFPFGPG